ncbi:MFS general substrate transporter [Microthyrium microscopicum]|uniref:MFS general substrate transporter n=1 Tax=Microthyrium microscopicum TaxID=703497 RepID=A0A6A6U3F8_9PEZI|nr:MFS general substrate transporter [Microthyrium microscopicum]
MANHRDFDAVDHLPAEEYDEKNTRRLLRKVDLNLIPLLSLLYFLSFLDRSNIGNARLANLERDLHMSGLNYNNALAIFFPFYVAAEIPSNLMMQATRPSRWIPSIMVVWGLMCIIMGFVKSYAGLMAVRAALGLAEGGLFPGITFYLTLWYCRHETGLRMSLFFSAATLAGAFGGLLARAIMLIDGKGGLASWQWIFVIEGIATVIIATVAFFVMNDLPETARFLTEHEKMEVVRRLHEDHGPSDEKFSMKYIWDAFKDWKIWAYCLATVGIFTPLYCISLFLPTIVKDLGYTNNKAQLMTVPPYVFACACCICNGFVADKIRQRGLLIAGFLALALTGAIILAASPNAHVKYFGTFFLAGGIYTCVPAICAWNGNNIQQRYKRSVGMALQGAMGNLGGIISAYMYLPKDGPQYHRGHGALCGVIGVACVTSLFLTWWFRKENKRAGMGGGFRYTV